MKTGLFQRLFWRFLFALLLSMIVLVGLTHWYQARYFKGERHELHRRAIEIAGALQQEITESAMDQWKEIYPETRMVVVDQNWQIQLDSHPEKDLVDLHLFRAKKPLTENFIAEAKIDGDYRLVVMQPMVLRFPQTLQPKVPWLFHAPQWQLIVILMSLAALASFLLYPLVRSLSKTFRQLSDLAGEVAGGHFGKELSIERSDELGGLIQSFNHMSRKLAEAELLNTRLIHDVSHELRSPLGRIRALADTIRYRPKDMEQCLENIDQEVALLDRLVEDLATAAKIESQPQAMLREKVSLRDWVREMFERFQKQLKAAGIEWRFEFEGEDQMVLIDSQRLAQALGNLVENSASAMTGRDDSALVLRCLVEKEGWHLEVVDNGPGIPEEDLPFVFRRFYRVAPHRDREAGGAGLGLSIAKAIVEAHGGRIELHSKPGIETKVTITVPMTPDKTI